MLDDDDSDGESGKEGEKKRTRLLAWPGWGKLVDATAASLVAFLLLLPGSSRERVGKDGKRRKERKQYLFSELSKSLLQGLLNSDELAAAGDAPKKKKPAAAPKKQRRPRARAAAPRRCGRRHARTEER